MPIPLRADFNSCMTRAAAKRSKDGPQARRLLALAAIYDGATRTQAAKIGGVTLQIVRDWVVKFNAHGPEGLVDRKPPGHPLGGGTSVQKKWGVIDTPDLVFQDLTDWSVVQPNGAADYSYNDRD
jgi:hypothetical protein